MTIGLIIGVLAAVLPFAMSYITGLNARLRKVEATLEQILERMPNGSIDWPRIWTEIGDTRSLERYRALNDPSEAQRRSA